jgi:hypothetical protein
LVFGTGQKILFKHPLNHLSLLIDEIHKMAALTVQIS